MFMVHELPKVEIKGKLYYQDDRLKEFRAVDNPHDRIDYKDYFKVAKPYDAKPYREYMNPMDVPVGRQPFRLLDHTFGDPVKEIVVMAFHDDQSSMLDIIVEKNQEALIKEGFDGCEIKRNDRLKTRFLICSK